MSKPKTHTGSKKRFRLTATGKVKFKHAKMRHILTKKDKGLKRQRRRSGVLAERDARAIRTLLGKHE